MGEELTCPVCGSANITEFHLIEEYQVVYGECVEYVSRYFRCRDCDEEGDFAGYRDEALTAARRKSIHTSVSKMLEILADRGIDSWQVQRGLGLPYGWFTKHLADHDYSIEFLTILRLVVTFPAILHFTANGFVGNRLVGNLITYDAPPST